MITLIEKRIQDLESRIPTFLAKMEEQQSKMAEIFSFPNDLAEVRTICQSLNGVLKEFMDAQNSGLGDVNSKISTFFNALSELKAVIDNEVKSNLNNLSSQLNGQSAAISNQNSLQSALENNHNDLIKALASVSERVASSENKIEKGSQVIGSVYDKLNNLVVDHNNLKVSVEATIDQISQMMTDSYRLIQKNIDEKIDQVTSKIKEFPEIPVPKDYDAVISDIKSDIKALQVPSDTMDPKVNDKIKSLEQAIAQIFSLLKKLEPGS
jgi:chromosome segregation ATPase